MGGALKRMRASVSAVGSRSDRFSRDVGGVRVLGWEVLDRGVFIRGFGGALEASRSRRQRLALVHQRLPRSRHQPLLPETFVVFFAGALLGRPPSLPLSLAAAAFSFVLALPPALPS
jgi:hypothetical protein